MELVNEFVVPVGIDEAWALLTDVERIAPCMPGAELQEVEGDEYRGVVKVKVGPVTAQYKGKATFVERDEAAHKVVLKAEGRDSRGAGNASAPITATLVGDGDKTSVKVVTDLTITGKAAQFGRGVLADVCSKLIGQFTSCLETNVLSGAPARPPRRPPTPPRRRRRRRWGPARRRGRIGRPSGGRSGGRTRTAVPVTPPWPGSSGTNGTSSDQLHRRWSRLTSWPAARRLLGTADPSERMVPTLVGGLFSFVVLRRISAPGAGPDRLLRPPSAAGGRGARPPRRAALAGRRRAPWWWAARYADRASGSWWIRGRRSRRLAYLAARRSLAFAQVRSPPGRHSEALDEFHVHTAEQVFELLGGMKGAIMKLGQMFSSLADGLPEAYQQALRGLQQGAPPMAPHLVADVVTGPSWGSRPSASSSSSRPSLWPPPPSGRSTGPGCSTAPRWRSRCSTPASTWPSRPTSTTPSCSTTPLASSLRGSIPSRWWRSCGSGWGRSSTTAWRPTTRRSSGRPTRATPGSGSRKSTGDGRPARVLTTEWVSGRSFYDVCAGSQDERDGPGRRSSGSSRLDRQAAPLQRRPPPRQLLLRRAGPGTPPPPPGEWHLVPGLRAGQAVRGRGGGEPAGPGRRPPQPGRRRRPRRR